jgi:hypothetical protein
MQAPFHRNRTRRVSTSTPSNAESTVGLNTELETFLNLNAADAYKRQWHRLERGLRLNRIRKFVDSEKARLTLTDEDTEYLKLRLEKALDKKMLNSKTCVVYDPEKEEIQEIKGLVYHKTADGRILSNLIDKKNSVTFRKKATGSSQQQKVVAPAAVKAAPVEAADE